MSEGSAEGGGAAPLSTEQFGVVTQTAQSPGTGIFAMGWGRASNKDDDRPKSRRRKKRKRSR